MTEPYDSAPNQLAHVNRVVLLLLKVRQNLLRRGQVHDASKFKEPEKSMFDVWEPQLQVRRFGTPEYAAALVAMGPALDHHYAANDHHPNGRGIEGMSLMALMEWVCDCKAAADAKGVALDMEYQFERFNVAPQLQAVIRLTVREMGW